MTKIPKILISKSRYMSGLRCDKLLWCRYHDQDLIPPHGASTEALFRQGHEVGRLAQKVFPDGVEVSPGSYWAEDTVPPTRDLLKKRIPLFEAGFVHGNVYVRVDVLNPVNDEWDLYEVKSSTKYDPEKHLADVAVQKYVLENNGLKIRRCYLMHLDKEYVKNDVIDPGGLFRTAEITRDVDSFLPGIEADLERTLRVIRLDECPQPPFAPNCWQLGGCDLQSVCWDVLPEDHVLALVYGKSKGLKLLEMEIAALKDIPEGFSLSATQNIQVSAAKSGEPYANRAQIQRFLEGLEYPLNFLDFETIWPGIPIFDGVHPYQHIPFQYSLHVVDSPGSKPVHYTFLAEGKDDPRPELLKELRKVIRPSGSVIAFNAGFESFRLNEMAEAFPEYGEWVRSVDNRIVDLRGPFRSFWYYHPDQGGSTSMKEVLPALTGMKYSDLEISEGGTASDEYFRITFDDVSDEERQKVRKQLEEYCKLDTEGMVEILTAFNNLIGGAPCQD